MKCIRSNDVVFVVFILVWCFCAQIDAGKKFNIFQWKIFVISTHIVRVNQKWNSSQPKCTYFSWFFVNRRWMSFVIVHFCCVFARFALRSLHFCQLSLQLSSIRSRLSDYSCFSNATSTLRHFFVVGCGNLINRTKLKRSRKEKEMKQNTIVNCWTFFAQSAGIRCSTVSFNSAVVAIVFFTVPTMKYFGFLLLMFFCCFVSTKTDSIIAGKLR